MASNDILWQRFCQGLFLNTDLGVGLDTSRIDFAPDFLESMTQPAQLAFEQMTSLEQGAIANPDEKRMVGHYWLRTPEKAPTEDIRRDIVGTLTELSEFVKKISSGTILAPGKKRFSHVLLIGIGGSALGPQFIADALWAPGRKMEISYFDNTDPDGMSRVIESLGDSLPQTLVIAISKSGGTPETRNGVEEARAAFTQRGLEFPRHAIAVTCRGSKLDEQAKAEGWLTTFPMWDWVGGRTSIFSPVGLLPAALLGIDINEFLAGARAMDEITRTQTVNGNPAMLLALAWYSVGQGKGMKDMVILPYKDRLVLFSKYLQQLVMESLGKERDLKGNIVHQGIAVYGNKGSTDQHAYIQQLRDGIPNFFATFIEVLRDDCPLGPSTPSNQRVEFEPGVTSGDYLSGFLQGTRRALYENKRESITITIDELNTRIVGALIALYERAVGFYASLVNVNAYHQPGVEAGKKAAGRVIELQLKVTSFLKSQSNSKPMLVEEIAKGINEAGEIETVYKILEHLAANKGRGIARTGERGPRASRYAYQGG